MPFGMAFVSLESRPGRVSSLSRSPASWQEAPIDLLLLIGTDKPSCDTAACLYVLPGMLLLPSPQDFIFPNDFSCPNGCVMRWE